jgi:signal transduction histidine kinase
MRDLWTTIQGGRVWRGEIRNRAKDGTYYWVDTTIVPFLDDRGRPFKYMAIRYEITERKRSEELLREQAALARLGQMAAVVAHEVKNPIAGIRGALRSSLRMPADARGGRSSKHHRQRLDALNGVVRTSSSLPGRGTSITTVDLHARRRDGRPHQARSGVGTVVSTATPSCPQTAAANRVSQHPDEWAQAMRGDGGVDVDIRTTPDGLT